MSTVDPNNKIDINFLLGTWQPFDDCKSKRAKISPRDRSWRSTRPEDTCCFHPQRELYVAVNVSR